MNIGRFSVAEMYSNSQGKTSASLVAGHVLIVTGCVMGVRGAFISAEGAMLQGLAFATLGTGLLTVRRFTPDKKIPIEADSDILNK